MARGGKRGHKGGTKRFTNPQQLAADKEKEEKAKAWRRQRGEESSSEEEEEKESDNDASDESGGSDDDGVSFQKEKVTTKKKTAGGAGAKAESTSESSEEESSEDEDRKKKGVEGLIEIENPNLAIKKQKKVSELTTASSSSKPQLTRREREEIDKQKAKVHYQKLHAAGKTDEARADLARLAIIRKQREDAAKKREDEQKAKEDAAKAKKDTTDKATGKKK